MDPIVIILAFGCGYLASLVNLPPLVGYLAAGFGLSAMGYAAGQPIEMIANIGVTILLFSIGLKLKVKGLLKPEIWGGATLHLGLTTGLFTLIVTGLSVTGLSLFALDTPTALMVAFALSFSSTVFAVKILEESGRSSSLNGRTAIGVLVMQDIFAVLFLTFSTGKMPTPWALALVIALPAARKLFMRMLDNIGHGELQVLFGFFLAFVAGSQGFEAVGLKADLGALIMGMLLADHARAKDMANSLLNIKDFLLVGFFLKIGLAGLPDWPVLGAALILIGVLPLKSALYFLIFTRFKLRARTAFITTCNLANYSEFGLIVGTLAVSSGWLPPDWLLTIAIALSLSFILASPLNRAADTIFDRIRARLEGCQTRECHPDEEPYEPGTWQIVIMGMGRVGTGAYDYFTDKYGPVVLGIDFSADTVDKHLESGRQTALADVSDPDFWRRMPERQEAVRLVVLTIPVLSTQLYAARMLRESGYTGEIGAVAQYDDEVGILREAGVNTSFNVFKEAGAGLASHINSELELKIEPSRMAEAE